MRDVDSDGRGRGDDGLTLRQELNLHRRQVTGVKRRRWETTERGRMQTVEFLERTVEDESVPIVFRLMASKVYLGVEAQNQADERMDVGGGENQEERVILVLPANGSEVKADVGGDVEGEVDDD